MLEDEESECGEPRPVTDVIDTVLSSVQMVRAASAFRRGGQQARFSWTTLITMLRVAISENIYFAYGSNILYYFSIHCL